MVFLRHPGAKVSIYLCCNEMQRRKSDLALLHFPPFLQFFSKRIWENDLRCFFSSLTDDLQLSESSFVISQTHFKGVSILLLFSPLSPSLNENLVVPLVIRVQ